MPSFVIYFVLGQKFAVFAGLNRVVLYGGIGHFFYLGIVLMVFWCMSMTVVNYHVC